MKDMDIINFKICGVDPHKRRFTAVIINSDNGTVIDEQTLSNNRNGTLKLAHWLTEENCREVVIEISNNFWYTLYHELVDLGFKVHAVSPSKVPRKHKKSDRLDAAWTALMFAKKLVDESYVPDATIRKLRSLVRLRRKLVEERTSYKNMVHALLSSVRLDLKSVFSDIFGVSGMRVLVQLAIGEVGNIIETVPTRKQEILRTVLREAYINKLDREALLLILDNIKRLNDAISQVEMIITEMITENDELKRILEILMSIRGVNLMTAATVIAEVGDFERFETEKQIAGWSGLVPATKESNKKQWGRGITKRGSPYLRHALTEAAGSIVRSGTPTELYRFYRRVMLRSGHKVALVALARKLLTVMYILVIRGRYYKEGEDRLYSRKLKRVEELRRGYKSEVIEACERIMREKI